MTAKQQNKQTVSPKIGDVYVVRFDGCGSEQSGLRPGVVFQNNVGNAHSPNLIVLPMTSSLKKLSMPTHVLVKASDTELLRDSVVICENPQCISKDRLGRYITRLPAEYMQQIAAANLLATSAISYLELKDLVSLWEKSVRMNSVA